MQARKVYVQDRLRESGALVWRLLQGGAHFYVCGDAAHMAGAVEHALLTIIQAHQVCHLSWLLDTPHAYDMLRVYYTLLSECAPERLAYSISMRIHTYCM